MSFEPDERAHRSLDIFADAAPNPSTAEAIAWPCCAAEVAGILLIARAHGIPVAVRGGGLSYSGGYAPTACGVLLDTARLNQIVDIDLVDAVATVGAGCTWIALHEALSGSGYEPALLPPISGEFSTIGGALSQGLPGDLNAVLGLEVVLPDGTIVKTGAAGTSACSKPFSRNAGPDLTGLFLGDAGTMGIKLSASLRLRPAPNGIAHASLAFSTFGDMTEAMAAVARTGLASRCMGLDPFKARSATKVGLREGLGTLWRVIVSERSRLVGLRQAARVVASLGGERQTGAWQLHLTTEGPSGRAAADAMAIVRSCCGRATGSLAPAVPIALYARPFAIRGVAGAQGERWVPVNGIFPLSSARKVSDALEGFASANAPSMVRHGIGWSILTSAMPTQILFEPMLTWRDTLAPVALRALGPKRLARIPEYAPDPAVRAVVAALRHGLRTLLDDHGAIHVGYGRFYPYASPLTDRLRSALDPAGLLSSANLCAASTHDR